MLDWTDEVRRGALLSGAATPTTDPGILWARYLKNDGTYYTWNGSAWIPESTGGPSTVADGGDVNAGTTTDAAATAGGTGTLSAKQRAISRDIGGLTETAPGTDTASSGLNGRAQRIAQRITSLIALLPTALSTLGALKTAILEAPRSTGVVTLNNKNALGSDAALDIKGYGTVILNVSGNLGSTVTFQASTDDVTYINVGGHQRGSHFYTSTTITTGVFEFNNLAGFSSFRANITVAAGAVTATAYGSAAPATDPLGQTEISPNTSTVYRSGITAADLMAVPGALTTSVVTGGSLANTTTYNSKVVAGNGYGRTTATTGTQRTTSSPNLTLRIAIPQVTGATFYDVFVSTEADPKFVGRITETQRASGILITAQDTTGAGGTAGAVDVQVAGSGLQSLVTAAQNTAYVVPASPVVCSGYQIVDFDLIVSRTGDDVALALTVVPFFLNPVEGAYFMGQVTALSFGGVSGATNSNRQRLRVECRGNTGVALLVQSIAGTGAAVTMYATLS